MLFRSSICRQGGGIRFRFGHVRFAFRRRPPDGARRLPDGVPQRFELLQLRHPLLPMADAVPNDLRLGANFRVMVISGPNGGGKTVAMKAAALAALFVRSYALGETLEMKRTWIEISRLVREYARADLRRIARSLAREGRVSRCVSAAAQDQVVPYAEDDDREAFNVMFVWEAIRPLLHGLTSFVIPDEAMAELAQPQPEAAES